VALLAVGKYGSFRMMVCGVTLMLSGALLMLLLAFIVQPITASIVVIPVAIFIGGGSFVFANSFALAMNPFAKIAGIAGSTFGFMQILGGAITSGLHAHLHEKNQLPLAFTLLTCASITAVVLWVIRGRLSITNPG